MRDGKRHVTKCDAGGGGAGGGAKGERGAWAGREYCSLPIFPYEIGCAYVRALKMGASMQARIDVDVEENVKMD
jgi:hypothetical protein